MSKINMDITQSVSLAKKQKEISKELEKILASITLIKERLKLDINYTGNIQKKLNVLIEEIKKENVSVITLSNQLFDIIELYKRTEMGLAPMELESERTELQELINDYDKNSITFDMDDKNGSYGSDQGNMAHHKKGLWFFGFRWFEDEELYAYIRKHPRYKKYTQTQIAKLMDEINNEGCGYAAIVNNIFLEYEGREKEFEKTFGFPMYGKDGKLNYDYLIVDFYASTDDKYFLDDKDGAVALTNDVMLQYVDNPDDFRKKYGCDMYNGNAINPEAQQKILDEYKDFGNEVELKMEGTTLYSLSNRFDHYMNEKGLSFENDYYYDLSQEDIQNRLDQGENVNIATRGFNLYTEDGRAAQKNVDGHWMTITGITDDGRYIVSSWGERYFLNPAELNTDGTQFMVTDISPK